MATDNDILEKARKGKLHIDCWSIDLRQDGGDPPQKCSGPGYIFQNESGWYSFKLYAYDAADFHEFHRDLRRKPRADRLIPDQDYFTLTAHDYQGRCWVAKRIIPRVSPISNDINPRKLLVEGVISQLENIRSLELLSVKNYLNLAIYQE